jgi:hypothetical protein
MSTNHREGTAVKAQPEAFEVETPVEQATAAPFSVQHFLHRVVALLHDPQLHQHDPDLLPRAAVATRADRAPVSNIWWSCQRSGGTV